MKEEAETILKAEGLSKHFKSAAGAIEVLRSVDLEVVRGESLSIRGVSGSGKSTLLNVLSGLETADSGRLWWRGVEVKASRSRVGREPIALFRGRHIGFVFQSYYLVPELNALENILLGARLLGRPKSETRLRAKKLMERVGLEDRARQNPQQMSGGERQRIAIARALVNQPELILADEPTGNLDERTGEAVMKLLLEVTAENGSSLVLVTHNREFANRTDRLFQLKKGALDTVI